MTLISSRDEMQFLQVGQTLQLRLNSWDWTAEIEQLRLSSWDWTAEIEQLGLNSCVLQYLQQKIACSLCTVKPDPYVKKKNWIQRNIFKPPEL